MPVTVRGISFNEVSFATGKRVIVNEVPAGVANGIITGVILAVIATGFSFGEFGVFLGAVIGVSMVANLAIAGFFGAVTPLVLDRLGYDPRHLGDDLHHHGNGRPRRFRLPRPGAGDPLVPVACRRTRHPSDVLMHRFAAGRSVTAFAN